MAMVTKPRLRRIFRRRPLISIVVVAYCMSREVRRTLTTLSPTYQRDVLGNIYEIIVVDNGSTPVLENDVLDNCAGVYSRILRLNSGNVSPCFAVNSGVSLARGRFIAVMVDGARMVSPGLVSNFVRAISLFPNPFIYTLGWHLGSEPQNYSMLKGYNQQAEDELLDSFDWRNDGYLLFDHSSLALSCSNGWFSPINESNCFLMSRRMFFEQGGFNESFCSPGGGLVNLDFFREAIESNKFNPVLLLGEGSFHQFHGGVATNVDLKYHPWDAFHAEYQSIRGKVYKSPSFEPYYFGRLSNPARQFLAFCKD